MSGHGDFGSVGCMSARSGVVLRGPHAALQFAALRVYAALTARVGYFAMQRFSWLLGDLLGNQASAVIEVGSSGGKLRIYLSDGYWTKLLWGREYEPNVGEILARSLEPGTAFLDCGANIGYWSVIASREHQASVVAIEPAQQTFERLSENQALNNGSFALVRAALWSTNGGTQTLVSHSKHHAGASVVGRRERAHTPGYAVEEVGCRSLDSVVEEFFPAADRVVLKLDVEGAEAKVLAGGRQLFAGRDVLLLYEDHGADDDCGASRAVIAIPGYAIYEWVSDGFRPVGGIDSVRAQKTNRSTGYNFVAMRADSYFSRCITAE